MARRRLSQMDMARTIGKPQTTLSRWLDGNTKLTLEQLELIGHALGVSAPELVSWGMVEPVGRARQGSNLRPSDYGLLPVGVPLLEQHTLALAV